MADMATIHPRGNDQRRERQRFEARRAILDATEELVIESEGCDFSIRSLGQRCGYSAPTVYHYFGDKDGLIDALLEERTEKLGEQFEALPALDDPLEELRALMARSVEFWVSNPTLARLIWSATSKGESRMPAVMDQVEQRFGAAVRALTESGRLGGLDEDMAGQMVRALNQGLISQRIHQPEYPWSPTLTQNAIDSLLRGMTQPVLGGTTP
jgi:AcrR family transcriptional regulator